MHHKSESDLTSLAASSPPHSPPRRPIYYVMSPSHDAADKMSHASTPGASPPHHPPRHVRYTSSPIHHSLESSTNGFSASVKSGGWRKLEERQEVGDVVEEEEMEEERRHGMAWFGAMFVVGFVGLFTLFSFILWGASRVYKPEVAVKAIVFHRYNIHSGADLTGVPTQMLSISSTVQIKFRNTATFFGVHVSSSPFQLYYYDLMIASGQMKEFYQNRKSERLLTTTVGSTQLPLYGAGTALTSRSEGIHPANVPLNLTFTLRSRGFILGKLVKSKFYRHVQCRIDFKENRLRVPVNLQDCHYHSRK